MLIKTFLASLLALSAFLILKIPKAFAINKAVDTEKKIFPEYPWLEQATPANSQYEILRLNGKTASSLRYVSSNNSFIYATTFVSAGATLWRLTPAGKIVDSYSPDGDYEGALPYSGVFFRKDNYVDWAFTGEKQAKPYLNIYHQETLTSEKLNNLLATAEQIVWSREIYYAQKYRGMDEDVQYHYRLKSTKGWSLLITKEQLMETEFPAVKTALSNHQMNDYKGPPLLISYPDETPISVSDSNSPIHLLQFKKIGESKSGFMDINNSAWIGDYGLGHFRLTLQGEALEFKSFHRIVKSNPAEPQHDSAMTFYDRPKASNGPSDLRILSLNGGRNPARSPSETGSYLIREKISGKTKESLTSAEQDYLSQTNRLIPLHIEYRGLQAVGGHLGPMAYFNGQQEYSDANAEYTISAKPRAMPMALSVSFAFPSKNEPDKKLKRNENNNTYYSYAIKLNDSYYSWSDKNNGDFTLLLDYQETLTAYQTLSWKNGDPPLKLILTMEFVKNGVELAIALSNETQAHALKKVRLFTMFGQELDPEQAYGIFDKQLISDIKTIRGQYDIARKEPQKIPQTLELIRNIIHATPHPTHFNSIAKDASWFLLNGAIEAKDQQLQLDVVNNYIVSLFPLTKVNAGLDSFVERAVKLAEESNNQELQKNIAQAFFTENPAIDYHQSQFLLERSMLDQAYRLAMLNSLYIENYLWLSTMVFSNNAEIEDLAEKMATHYTRLVIKSMNEKNYKNAKSLAKTYMQKIYTTTGFDEKSTDLFSNALVAGIVAQDEDLAKEIISFIESHPPITKTKNHILWFNMACYYAILNNKTKLLEAVNRSLKDGQSREKFLADEDFKAYRKDNDFIKALQSND